MGCACSEILIFTIKEQTSYRLWESHKGFLELLELFLSTLGFLDLENVEPDSLAQRTTLTHYHKVTQGNISKWRREREREWDREGGD